MSSPEEVNSARKWLLLQKESQLCVLDEANDILKSEQRQVNIVMVCGRLRTGKSYLMNCLLREPCFGVSSQARSFTKGVDLSARLVDVDELGGKKSGPRVAFADLEGQGDKGLEQDLKIATPLLIVSKVVLLMEVCPGGPSSESILESLQLLMMAGNCIAERKDRRGLFGCLHIVLRDCAHDEVECRSIIFDHEDEVNAETDQHAKAMQKRNEIRKSIEISFEAAPKAWCMPKLAEDVAPDDYTKANKEGFADKIDDIRNTFAQQLSEPKLLNGRPLTGSVIAALMPELAEAMRSNEPALNPPSLVDRVAAMEVQRAMDELVERAGKEADVLLGKLPLHGDQLQKELTTIQNRASLEFASRLKVFWPADSTAEAVTGELNRKVEAHCQSLQIKNSELLVQLAEKILQDERTKAEKMVQAICLPLASRDLEAKLDLVKEEVLGALDDSLQMLTTELAELTKRGVCGHFFDLLEEKRSANLIEIRRRRSRLAKFSIVPLLILAAASLAIFMAGDVAECAQILASGGHPWLNPRCWRHLPEVHRQKDQKEQESAAEEARRAEEEAEAKAEQLLLEEQKEEEEIRMARMAQLHGAEIDIDPTTGIGVTIAGALAIIWRRHNFFR